MLSTSGTPIDGQSDDGHEQYLAFIQSRIVMALSLLPWFFFSFQIQRLKKRQHQQYTQPHIPPTLDYNLLMWRSNTVSFFSSPFSFHFGWTNEMKGKKFSFIIRKLYKFLNVAPSLVRSTAVDYVGKQTNGFVSKITVHNQQKRQRKLRKYRLSFWPFNQSVASHIDFSPIIFFLHHSHSLPPLSRFTHCCSCVFSFTFEHTHTYFTSERIESTWICWYEIRFWLNSMDEYSVWFACFRLRFIFFLFSLWNVVFFKYKQTETERFGFAFHFCCSFLFISETFNQ